MLGVNYFLGWVAILSQDPNSLGGLSNWSNEPLE